MPQSHSLGREQLKLKVRAVLKVPRLYVMSWRQWEPQHRTATSESSRWWKPIVEGLKPSRLAQHFIYCFCLFWLHSGLLNVSPPGAKPHYFHPFCTPLGWSVLLLPCCALEVALGQWPWKWISFYLIPLLGCGLTPPQQILNSNPAVAELPCRCLNWEDLLLSTFASLAGIPREAGRGGPAWETSRGGLNNSHPLYCLCFQWLSWNVCKRKGS